MNFSNIPTLTKNTKSVTLQFSSASIGFCEVPDDVARVGVISSASTVRVALDTVPSSASTVIGGSALNANFTKGFPLSPSGIALINWLDIGYGSDRVLYFLGVTSLPQVTIILV